ncbi:hypothetical protein PhaeoP97_02929 [Phaeobacter porticola]|uniref:Uncharacterized protein n=1 Tax=Phaeobacter porticola TaxID=1844006 RepID=A0A1L3I842_9RHOB|nr:hypothetical protein PhaeoP97_02929 [Phaeobacter porticola]
MSSVTPVTRVCITAFTELLEVDSEAIKRGEHDKSNSCRNQSVQSNLLMGFQPGAERAFHV